MRVSPHDFIKLTKLLNHHKIRHIVQIFDLQAVINRQNDMHSQTSSWYNEYHPIDEVNNMRYFPGIILPILLLLIQNYHLTFFIIWITSEFRLLLNRTQSKMCERKFLSFRESKGSLSQLIHAFSNKLGSKVSTKMFGTSINVNRASSWPCILAINRFLIDSTIG